MLVIAIAGAASIATSTPLKPRAYPAWQFVAGQRHTQECVDVYAWVSKSGKTGFGMSIELRSRGNCMVEVATAELQLDGRTLAAADRWDAIDMKGHSLLFAYIPFEFDNNQAWNDELRDGVVQVQLTTNGNGGPPWRITAEHRRNATHQPGYGSQGWEDTKPAATNEALAQ